MRSRLTIGLASLGLVLGLAPLSHAPIEIRKVIANPSPVVIEIPKLQLELSDLPLSWQKLAMCESGGRPNAVSGTRKQFQGLFQIEYPRTWVAHGGPKELPPKAASVMEQFYVALHIYVDRGSKPWPYCGKFLKEDYGK
jgi:resuscitation-promoting factor RpfB